MTTKELRPITSMGMFDLFKGIAIVAVVAFHTSMYYVGFYDPVASTLGNILLCGFILVAGYGIRKRPVKKCLRQIKNAYLKPYLLTAVFTPLLFTVVHTSLYHYLPGAATEALKVLAGLLLGQYPTAEYFGVTVFSCGPIWFVVAIAGGWFLFNLILNHTRGRGTVICVLISAVIGSFAPRSVIVPYCLLHTFAVVPALYAGYLAWQKKLYERAPDRKFWIALVISAGCVCIGINTTGISLSAQAYPAGPVSLLSLCAMSFFVIYLCVRINRRYNLIVNALEWLGHNSYTILCLHTIEYTAGSWYYYVENGPSSPLVGFLIMLCLRSLFIALGLVVISLFRKVVSRQKAAAL